jgi:O-antigen ligase
MERRASPPVPSSPDSTICYAVFGLLLLSPLCFGAVEPWSIFLLEASSATLLIIWTVRQFTRIDSPLRWNSIFIPMLAFGALVVYQITFGATAYVDATVSSFLLYAAYAVVSFLATQTFNNARQVKVAAAAFSIYGFSVAFFALLQSLSSNGKIYWVRLPRTGGWIYGPYVNHNHYAGLMEMLFPIPLVFALTHFAKGGMRTLALIASSLMAATIFLSGSRGGVIAFFCEIALVAIVSIKQRSQIQFRSKLTLIAFAVLAISLLAWIGGHEITDRFLSAQNTRNEISAGLRLQIDRDLIKMFPHRPLLGWGLGTFADVYPRYRTFYTTSFIDQAHNDYLQLLIETGVAGLLTMLWFLWMVFRGAGKKLRNWNSTLDGAVALAALLGIVGILVHSFVDFNLQIPANAALFYVLCTVAAAESRFSFHEEHTTTFYP